MGRLIIPSSAGFCSIGVSANVMPNNFNYGQLNYMRSKLGKKTAILWSKHRITIIYTIAE